MAGSPSDRTIENYVVTSYWYNVGNMEKWRLLFSLILVTFLAGCGKAPTEAVIEPSPTSVEIAIPTDPPEPTPTETPRVYTLPEPPLNPTHYKLDLIFNYYSHFGSVTQQITYTNKSSQPMGEILLVVPPKNFENSYNQYSLAGDRVANFREEGIFTWLSLTSPLQLLDTTTINLSFRIYLPEHPGIYGYTNQQANISDWYPFIPPFDEVEGWLAYPRVVDENNIIVGESIVNEFSNFEVNLTLVSHADLIEVAASAPAEGSDGRYSYKLEHARAFTFSISDSYFEHEVVQDGVRIRSYVFMNQIEQGKQVVELGAQAMKLYGEIWFPYPRELVSIVVGDFLHNMEMDGLIMISYGIFDFYNGNPDTDLTLMTSHELSHMWFYGLIGSNHALEPWLDEAIATYSELLYYERYHPDYVDWWWQVRIYRPAPAGYVDSDIWIDGGYVPYRNAVYLKGVQFLHEIRQTVGEGVFFEALKDYAYTNTFNIATRQDFFEAFSRHTQTDLTPVIAKYFQN